MAETKKEKIKNIGLVAYKEIKQVSPTIAAIAAWKVKHPDIQFFAHNNLKPLLPIKGIAVRSEKTLRKSCHLILSLGGDGTFLSAARLMCDTHVPLLGINLGRLGFLADVTPTQLSGTLDQVVNGRYELTQRMMLKVCVYKGKKKILEDKALNDVFIAGQMGQALIDLKVETRNQYLTDYWADGLLISTPTGSTAYALSAGGPIIYPVEENICLTAINPKSLSIRPIILPVTHNLRITSKNHPRKRVKVVIDGRKECPIQPDDVITIKKHRTGALILRPKGASFLKAIREKLGWSGNQLYTC